MSRQNLSRRSLMLLAMSAALVLFSGSALARGRRGGGGGGGAGGGGGGMQAQPQVNQAAVQDRAALTTASTTYTQAQKDYNDAKNKVDADFRTQPEYADAQKAVNDAEKGVSDARDAVEADLKKNNKDYKAALAQEAADQKKLDQLKADHAPHDEIAAQADKILNAKSDKLLQAAVDSDVPTTEAKKKLTDAVAALKVEKDKMVDAEKADANLSKLKDTMDADKATVDDARKKLASDGG